MWDSERLTLEPVVVVENCLVSMIIAVKGADRPVTRLATVELGVTAARVGGWVRAGRGRHTVGLGGRGHTWEKLVLLCIESWRVLCRLEDMLRVWVMGRRLRTISVVVGESVNPGPNDGPSDSCP